MNAMRFQELLTDQGNDGVGLWHTPAEIATVLYSNFEDLLDFEQERVLSAKLRKPLFCLSMTTLVQEEEERYEVKDYFGNFERYAFRKLGRFRARPGAFARIEGYTRAMLIDANHSIIEVRWDQLRRGYLPPEYE